MKILWMFDMHQEQVTVEILKREFSRADIQNFHLFCMALQEGTLDSSWRSSEMSNGEDQQR